MFLFPMKQLQQKGDSKRSTDLVDQTEINEQEQTNHESKWERKKNHCNTVSFKLSVYNIAANSASLLT